MLSNLATNRSAHTPRGSVSHAPNFPYFSWAASNFLTASRNVLIHLVYLGVSLLADSIPVPNEKAPNLSARGFS